MTSENAALEATSHIEIGIDCIDPVALASFWALATGYSVGDLDPAGIYLDLQPPTAELPLIYLQRVPEKKLNKNRVHLDLYVEDIAQATTTLESAGAIRLGGTRTGSAGGTWQVMADPEGNEFCLCQITTR